MKTGNGGATVRWQEECLWSAAPRLLLLAFPADVPASLALPSEAGTTSGCGCASETHRSERRVPEDPAASQHGEDAASLEGTLWSLPLAACLVSPPLHPGTLFPAHSACNSPRTPQSDSL